MATSKPITSSLTRYFWHFVKRYKYSFIGLFSTASFWSVSTSVSPLMIKVIIDNIVSFKGEADGIYAVVAMPAAIYIGFRILISIFARIENIIQVYTIPNIKAEIRADMFERITNHSFDFFQKNMAGNLSNKILNIASCFERIYVAVHEGLYPCLLSFLVSSVILFLTVPTFAFFFVIWFLLAMSITSYLSIRSIPFSNSRAEAESNVSGNIVDVFRNVMTMLIFFNKNYEQSYLKKVQEGEIRASKSLEWELFKIHLFRSISTTIMLIFMIVFLIEGWKNGWVTVGDFSFVSSTAFSMAHLTWNASKEFIVIYKEWGIAKQALSSVQAPYTNLDVIHAEDLKISSGKIEFQNVSFSYPEGSDVFENQSITIEACQKVGLVGASGSGKSTFVKLIMRFFRPQSGRIMIDNQDLSEVRLSSIRANIAMIPQNPGLFNRTIAENILYGNPKANFQEMVEAAKEAHCENFILQQPHDYDSNVGQQGEKLSAGQAQRLAIARAALRRQSKILILDEATSALDAITEKSIQDSIEHLARNKTTIIIAHRLSTLTHLDRILVFEDGRIVEDGTHLELLEKKGKYAQLWQTQNRETLNY